jgi:hypothetical protein
VGYEVHIERRDQSSISLDEWCSAVDAVDGMRLAKGDVFAQNPITGAEISIPHQEGDVEVYFSEADAWIPCVYFSKGRISFRPSDDFDDRSSPFRQALVKIAARLDAELIGDDGTVFN